MTSSWLDIVCYLDIKVFHYHSIVTTVDNAAGHLERERVKEDLAFAHRIIAYEDMHEGVGNHLTVLDPDDQTRMFVTPGHRYFADIHPQDILTMDASGAVVEGEGAPNQAAWCLHKPLHDRRPDAVCIIHLHSVHSTALMMQADGRLEERGSQAAAALYRQIAYYESYDGVLREAEEGEAMAEVLGDRNLLVLRNHGFIVVGPNLAIALEKAFIFERACRLQLLAESSGATLSLIPEDMIAEISREENLYLGRYLPGLKAYFQRQGM